MTRFLLAAAALSLAACTASSDDVGALGEDDVPALSEGTTVCPDNLWLDLIDYPEQALPAANAENWAEINGNRDGVNTTPSGLQYTVAAAGLENGVSPRPQDEIFAHYHGFFPNGDVFDSSFARGAPLNGPATAWIAGWNEALADMKVCEARTLYIPESLAYQGRANRPEGTLLFHMQLLRVNRPDEAGLIGVDND